VTPSWCVVTVNWLMGEENLDPPLVVRVGGERYEIEVRGNPDTFVTIKGWQPRPSKRAAEQPGDRRHRGALRKRGPRDVCRAGRHSKLLRSAAHHRPGRAKLECGRLSPWRSRSSSNNRWSSLFPVEDAFHRRCRCRFRISSSAGMGRSRRSRKLPRPDRGVDRRGPDPNRAAGRWRQKAIWR